MYTYMDMVLGQHHDMHAGHEYMNGLNAIGLCRDHGEVRCRSQTGLQGQERWPAGCAQGGARKVEDGWHGSTRAHAGDGSMQWQPGPFWETCLKACNCVHEHSCMIMRDLAGCIQAEGLLQVQEKS